MRSTRRQADNGMPTPVKMTTDLKASKNN